MCTPINITDSLLRCHCDKASNSSYGDEFILHCWHAYPWDNGLSDTSLFVRLDPIEYLRKTSNVSVLLPAICILGLCVLLIVFIFIHAYRHRQLRCSKHQKPWITLATILGIEKLEKIACKLKLTKEMAYVRGQLESQVFGYAMAILAVHLYGIEHQHEQPPENILKPTTEDTTFVLGLELPGSKKTVLQRLLTTKSLAIEIPLLRKVKNGQWRILQLFRKPTQDYQLLETGTLTQELSGFLHAIFSELPDIQRNRMLNMGGKTWLRSLVVCNNTKTLRLLLQYLTLSNRTALILTEYIKYNSILFYAVAQKSDIEVIKLLLDVLPDEHMDELLGRQNSQQQTVLHQAAITGQFEILRFLLSSVTHQPSNLLTTTDYKDATFLDYTIKTIPSAIIEIINHFHPDDKWVLMKNTSYILGDKTTIIHTLLDHHDHDVLNSLISSLSSRQQTILCMLQNGTHTEAITIASNSSCNKCIALAEAWKNLLIEKVTKTENASGEVYV